MDFYLFKKTGFKDRQSTKLRDANRRMGILVDVDIVNDSKIMLLHRQKDYTLLGTFLHILGKLDLETESWFVRKEEFDNWFRKTFGANKRSGIDERLQWLASVGLIEFEIVSNSVAKPANNVQTIGKVYPNNVETIAKVCPLDQPETQEYPEKDHPYIREAKQNNPPTPKGEDAFEKFWKVYPNKQKKEYARKIWSREKLDSKLEEIIRGVEMYRKTRQWQKDGGDYIPHGSTFLNQRLWLDDLNENGVAIGKKAYWQRVNEAPTVQILLPEGEVHHVPGYQLQWIDTSKTYLWAGQVLYPDQVKIPEVS